MLSLLRPAPWGPLCFAAVIVWAAAASAGITITTDPDPSPAAVLWPEPVTGNVIAAGPPKIEVVPDSIPSGLAGYNLDSVDLSAGWMASQVFVPTASFKLGAIAMYADGVGTLNTGTPAPDDHLPLTVHLFELVAGTTGASSLPVSYTLSTADTGNVAAVSKFGGGAGLPLQFDGVGPFTYEFVELNFTGVDQVELLANHTYAFEIWGNSLTGAFNPQRLANGSPGGTNSYAPGDSYFAENSSLTTPRNRPQTSSRDMFIAIYEAIPPQPDFDGDGDVDGADFVAWQTNFPMEIGAGLAEGDSDADGDVDGADFAAWQASFPASSPGVAPVPEPQAMILAAMAIPVFVRIIRLRQLGRS